MKSKTTERFHCISNRFIKMKGPDDIKFWRGCRIAWTLTLKTITLENSLPFFSKFEDVHTRQPSNCTSKHTPLLVIFHMSPDQQPFSTLLYVSKAPWHWRRHRRRFEGGKKDEVGYLFLHVPFCRIITCWLGPLTKGHNFL